MTLYWVSHSAEETRSLAASVALSAPLGTVFVLEGDLGAGKTCFVAGAGIALGVDRAVTSPTFVIAKTYAGIRGELIHVDAYRLNHLAELEDLGYEELSRPGSLTFIEWGDLVEGVLPEGAVRVRIEVTDDQTRNISVSASPELEEALGGAFGGGVA